MWRPPSGDAQGTELALAGDEVEKGGQAFNLLSVLVPHGHYFIPLTTVCPWPPVFSVCQVLRTPRRPLPVGPRCCMLSLPRPRPALWSVGHRLTLPFPGRLPGVGASSNFPGMKSKSHQRHCGKQAGVCRWVTDFTRADINHALVSAQPPELTRRILIAQGVKREPVKLRILKAICEDEI